MTDSFRNAMAEMTGWRMLAEVPMWGYGVVLVASIGGFIAAWLS